jgi:WD40 repeat protein
MFLLSVKETRQVRGVGTGNICSARGKKRQNDLHFSPDEHVLAIASEDLGIYDLTKSTAPRLLRSDHEHYGSVRFSQDGQTLLVITAASLIEVIDTQSGALQLKICCDSYYGEVVFTPDGQTIANAGHWPRLWDARSGRLVAALAANREIATLRPIAFDTVDRARSQLRREPCG